LLPPVLSDGLTSARSASCCGQLLKPAELMTPPGCRQGSVFHVARHSSGRRTGTGTGREAPAFHRRQIVPGDSPRSSLFEQVQVHTRRLRWAAGYPCAAASAEVWLGLTRQSATPAAARIGGMQLTPADRPGPGRAAFLGPLGTRGRRAQLTMGKRLLFTPGKRSSPAPNASFRRQAR
jgi:hypothetical protein